MCFIRPRCALTLKQALLLSHSTTSMHRANSFFRVGGAFARRCRTQTSQGLYSRRWSHIFIYCAFCRRLQTVDVKVFRDIQEIKATMANYIHVPEEAPAVPKIDVTVDENDYRSGALKLIKELRPNWKPSEVKIKVHCNSFPTIHSLSTYCCYYDYYYKTCILFPC